MLLCFSPCPNDTFIFHALLHNKTDTEGVSFDVYIADIAELNDIAIAGKGDAVKISFAAYPQAQSKYRILNSGSALGYGNGPLVVARQTLQSIDDSSVIAIPGKYTTAALLVRRAFPQVQRYVPMLFSDIPQAVLTGRADAGVIIHESRFTYEQYGLKLIADLGAWWEERERLPIPLGGIVIKRNLPLQTQCAFARILRRSVDYALQNPDASAAFVRHYAQELSSEVIERHIAMFVNEYTQSLSAKGRQAIRKLLHTCTFSS